MKNDRAEPTKVRENVMSLERIQRAGEFINWLQSEVNGRDLQATDRVRASIPCLMIAQDHHHAIVRLIDGGLYASAFALLRIAFEAYIRGEWLALCATDSEILRFLNGEEPPKIGRLICQLEETSSFSEKILSNIKDQAWKSMCAYSHTGGLQVQRWITADSIEPSYSAPEMLEVLEFAEVIGALSVIGFATLINDEQLAERVLDAVKK